MWKGLKRFFPGKDPTKTGVSVRGRGLANTVKNLEEYAEIAGLAQEGYVELAQDLARRMVRERPKVLVVGAQEGLSSALVDYAIGFAGRMGYEIVALRCGSPEGRGWGGKMPPPPGWVDLFRRATSQGVGCRTLAKPGTPAQCVAEAVREIPRLAFILTEEGAGNRMRVNGSLPILCLTRAR
jgi:hypothetical protein